MASSERRLSKGWHPLTRVALALLLMPHGIAAVLTEQAATGFTINLGTEDSGSFSETAQADGIDHVLYESSISPKRLDVIYHFASVPGTNPFVKIVVTKASTGGGNGHDDYTVGFSTNGSQRINLGSISASNSPIAYNFGFPDQTDLSSGVDITITDQLQTSDKRLNQLHIDQIVVSSTDAGPSTPSTTTSTAATATATGTATGPTATSTATLSTGTTTTATQSSTTTQGATTTTLPGGGPATSKIIAGYYEAWAIYNARKYYVRDIPFEQVTHINYAFANLDSSGKVVIGDIFADITNTKDPDAAINPNPDELPPGNVPQLLYMRDTGYGGRGPFPHLKVILSVGGWSWSENFSAAASTPEGRYMFASSVKDFVAGNFVEEDGTVHTVGGQLDGVDLDWEYPTGDTSNCGQEDNVCELYDPYTHAMLILAVRARLDDEFTSHKELSIAMPAGYWLIQKVMPPIVSNDYLKEGLDSHNLEDVVMRNPDDSSQVWNLSSQTAADALDYLHVMNYDMSGASYSQFSRHHAPLYAYSGTTPDPEAGAPDEMQRVNSHFAIQAYSYVHSDYSSFNLDNPSLDPVLNNARFPMSKLTFGIPMYGKGFKVDGSGSHDGHPLLFEQNRGIQGGGNTIPKGTWDGGQWGNSGIWAYWDIFTNLGGHQPGSIDPTGDRPYGSYIVDGTTWIGFDDIVLQTAKVEYAVGNGMAGVMFWSFPGDISTSTIRQGQTNEADYPDNSLVHNLANQLEMLAPAR